MDNELEPREIEMALNAIVRHPKGALELARVPAEMYVVDFHDARAVYVNFVRRDDVPILATYRTWVVTFCRQSGRVEHVGYFLSRRGEIGDDTLPQDEG